MANKYTTPTGDGYQAVVSAQQSKVKIATRLTVAREWEVGESVSLLDHDHGIAAVRGYNEDARATSTMREHSGARHFFINLAEMGALDISPGDDVRIYDLAEYDDRDGLLLVPSDEDPLVEVSNDA